MSLVTDVIIVVMHFT